MLIVGMLVGWLGVTLSACAQHDSEPIIQGKTLSVWLQQYNSTAVSGGEPKEQAEKAVRLIGTNAIPALLKMITQSSFWPSGRVTVNIIGIDGFVILGATASNAVPALVKIFEDRKSPSSQVSAAYALAGVGLGATAAIPALLRAATNSESNTHALAFMVLADIPASCEQTIPIATQALSDTNFSVKINAMLVLGKCGSSAKESVPALVELSTNTNFGLRSAACDALGKIHSLPDITLPALVACLSDPAAIVRREAAWNLGNFGILAKEAVPVLVELRNDKDAQVRSAAEEALKKINLEKN